MMKKIRYFFGKSVVLPLLFFVQANAAGYTMGEGVQLGESPVFLGGYFSMDYWHNLKGTSELALDDAAVMLYGSRGAWSAMAELEFNDAYRKRWGFEEETVTDLTLHVERTYIRYEPDEHYRVTLGKFNTPYGFWNLMPINVLRDTTSDPKVVERIVPRFTTGADFDITQCQAGRFTLMAQVTRDLDYIVGNALPYNNFDVDHHFALAYRYAFGSWTLRGNGGYYHNNAEDEQWLYGYGGARYDGEAWRLLAEAGYKVSQNGERSTFGAYMQATRRMFERHFAVLRLETVTEYVENSQDHVAVFGYTYRPVFPVALKAEYQWHSRENSDKLMVSLSMLF